MTNGPSNFTQSMFVLADLVKKMKEDKLKLLNYMIILDVQEEDGTRVYKSFFNDGLFIDKLQILNEMTAYVLEHARQSNDNDKDGKVTDNPDLSFLNEFKGFGNDNIN